MRILVVLLLILLVSGCTTMNKRKIVSPSEHMYYKGNRCYESKNFDKAIELYQKFIEKKPKSELVIPAKLNLGMAHYYKKNFKDAYTILKDIEIEDANIKNFVEKICETCKTQAADEIAEEEKDKAVLAAFKALQKGGVINIEVIDAYLDNFGSVVIKGKTDKESTISVDEKEIETKNNEFSATVSWKKGTSISLVATDESGSTGELNYYPDREAPDEPKGLQATNITSNSVEIGWDENAEEDIKGYKVYYKLSGGALQEIPDIIEETRYEVVGLQSLIIGARKTFQFYLRAVDKMNNESDDSDILEVVLP